MRDNFVSFRAKAGSLEITQLRQFQARGENAIRVLEAIRGRVPSHFAGRSGCVWLEDRPPGSSLATELRRAFDLVFCSTKEQGKPSPLLPFPCPNSIAWPQVGIPDGEALIRQLLEWDQPWRIAKIFWIGAETHPSRRSLHNLSRQRPDILDAELMVWEGNQTGRQMRYVSLPDHSNYKYLIDCPGVGYSGRIRWLLATGRPVFIVERDSIEPWHEELTPWCHYIPVRQDLSDLVENHLKVERDPALYSMIGHNAREFVTKVLCFERYLESISSRIAREFPVRTRTRQLF